MDMGTYHGRGCLEIWRGSGKDTARSGCSDAAVNGVWMVMVGVTSGMEWKWWKQASREVGADSRAVPF
jgi:hypothetical protein